MGVYTPDSNRVVHHTYADMTARQIVRPVHLVQYDQGLPIIAVKLYNDGLEYTSPVWCSRPTSGRRNIINRNNRSRTWNKLL